MSLTLPAEASRTSLRPETQGPRPRARDLWSETWARDLGPRVAPRRKRCENEQDLGARGRGPRRSWGSGGQKNLRSFQRCWRPALPQIMSARARPANTAKAVFYWLVAYLACPFERKYLPSRALFQKIAYF